ncbi:MAG: lytic transglycosylase domain-containing protein [Rickettsiaceae bacterium]
MRILSLLSIVLTIFLIGVHGGNCFAKEPIELKVFSLIKQKDWPKANAAANKTNNQALKKVVLSQQFLDVKYKGNSFEKITEFLLKNPSWPQKAALQISAENLLNGQTSNAAIIKWFSINKPLTGAGHKYYALVAAKELKDSPKLPAIIKSGWHKGSFSVNEQKEYHARFKNYLNKKDHIKKIDYNLRETSVTAARNSYYLVEPEYRKSFDAQIALIQGKKDAIKSFKAVPKKYHTPGLIYRYLEARKKDLPASSEVVQLVNAAKPDSEYADQIWKVQNYIAREYIEKKKYNDAYKVVSCHFAESAANKSDAEFLAGWLALRFLSKPQQAIEHFRKFNTVVQSPISKSRGIYWLARTHEALKDKDKADKLYYLAATKYPYTFYGQVATAELGIKKIVLPDNIDLKKHITLASSKVSNNHVFQATSLVSRFGSNALAQTYIKSAVDKTKNTSSILDLAAIMSHSANVHHMAWLTKHALQKHVLIKNYAYPIPYRLNNLPLEKPLIYSIIRQESVFDQRAISSAEAKGLMQLLNSTACAVARTIGDKCTTSKLTTDTSYNVKLGSNYLNQLVELFDGSYILAIAAYNGGPHKVKKWLEIYGDPRKMNNHRLVLDWIELIPFYETRNYVQRVLENLQIYRSILDPGSLFRLTQDLTLKKRIGAKK